MASNIFDLTVVGGGIVGLATAMEMTEKYPRVKIILLEKENQLAMHQTGHNSGVIHSGIYYRPGSIKAQTCVSGRRALIDFCDQHGILYDLCGKVILATDGEELLRLEELLRRGLANGVQGFEMIGPERLKEIEPHAKGIGALYVPTAGIIDFTQVAQVYAKRIRLSGGEIFTSQEVKNIVPRSGGLIIETPAKEFFSKYLINCAGLFADHLARMMARYGAASAREAEKLQIVPFRGEYYRIIPERQFLVKRLIYPAPNLEFPFLGVHCTRTIHGDVEAGPNAVLAFAREGYRKTDINIHHLWRTLCYKGFWSMAGNHWRMGLGETYRSVSKRAFVKALQRLIPDVRADDLVAGGSGVRAQAVSRTGALIDDFVITQTGNAIHVLNAPSPGATASLTIGKRIVEMAARSFSFS